MKTFLPAFMQSMAMGAMYSSPMMTYTRSGPTASIISR